MQYFSRGKRHCAKLSTGNQLWQSIHACRGSDGLGVTPILCELLDARSDGLKAAMSGRLRCHCHCLPPEDPLRAGEKFKGGQ